MEPSIERLVRPRNAPGAHRNPEVDIGPELNAAKALGSNANHHIRPIVQLHFLTNGRRTTAESLLPQPVADHQNLFWFAGIAKEAAKHGMISERREIVVADDFGGGVYGDAIHT